MLGALPKVPRVFLPGIVPLKLAFGLANIYAVILRIFQNQDRASTWLAFGLVWVSCAAVALASAYVVFQVSETRKRVFGR